MSPRCRGLTLLLLFGIQAEEESRFVKQCLKPSSLTLELQGFETDNTPITS